MARSFDLLPSFRDQSWVRARGNGDARAEHLTNSGNIVSPLFKGRQAPFPFIIVIRKSSIAPKIDFGFI